MLKYLFVSLFFVSCFSDSLVVIKRLEMKALYYETQEDAIESAKYLKGYRSRNWVFDDVIGEPILERFVTKYLHAKKAL